MLIRSLVELLTPITCVGCEKDGAILCSKCAESRIEWLGARCENYYSPALAGVMVGAYYDDVVKELITALKYGRAREAVGAVAQMVLAGLPEGFEVDLVTDVGISPGRYRERGYNQSALLARRVAREIGLPYRSLLGRTTSVHQVGSTRVERLRQMQGTFFAFKMLAGERVLIVDDVVTTGATLGECAAVLGEAGAGAVWGAVAARHAR